MRLRSFLKGAMLVAVSALLIVVVTLSGLLIFIYYNSNGGRDWGTTMEELSSALTWDGTAYSFTGEELLEEGRWIILLDEEGRVVWSLRKPSDVPEFYTISDVASFTRWYLNGYPVQCWLREDGLMVVGSPKGSMWKHDISMSTQILLQTPAWFLVFFCWLWAAYWVLPGLRCAVGSGRISRFGMPPGRAG